MAINASTEEVLINTSTVTPDGTSDNNKKGIQDRSDAIIKIYAVPGARGQYKKIKSHSAGVMARL
jgi:hypothetical protein